MSTLQKANDIFIATLSKPDATTADLMKNNIFADNTQFLDIDTYKNSQFIQDTFSKDGKFNEEAFNKAYVLAADKFQQLTDKEAEKSLLASLEYSPVSMVAPIKSKRYDTTSKVERVQNPFMQRIGHTQFNRVEQPDFTPEELAQQNKYFDTETGKWSETTVEDMPFLKKLTTNLAYATYDEDTVDEFGQLHRKGEWKTDANGRYYAETIGKKQALNKEYVKLADILTSENSWVNDYDFMDSDGFTKSTTGTVMKTLVQITPYVIPKLNRYYGALTASLGMARTLPTFYKSAESIFSGENPSALSDTATGIENWFGKFESSKSYEGREGFWNFESLSELVGDVFGQLHQQRAAASLSKYFMPSGGADEAFEVIKKRNQLSKSLSLGYMSLISASDVYNTALEGGYDRRTAGIASLLSAGALYKIMQFDEGPNGVGTWFLDKTTGYDRDISRAGIREAILEPLGFIQEGMDKVYKTGDTKALVGGVSKLKRFFHKNKEAFAYRAESLWKNMLVEGAEEVTEEVVQDAVKGIVDVASYFGWTEKKGSFGGVENVFSKEGLSRYLATFVGGAVGGALFDIQQNRIEPWLDPKLKPQKQTLAHYILRGAGDEIRAEIQRLKPFLNNYVSPVSTTVGGVEIMGAAGKGPSKADLIADHMTQYVQWMEHTIKDFIPTKESNEELMIDVLGNAFNTSMKDFVVHVESQFDKATTNFVTTAEEIKVLSEKDQKDLTEGERKRLEQLKETLKTQKEEIMNFSNGENYIKYLQQFELFQNKAAMKALTLLDVESYAYNKYGVDYQNISEDSPVSKQDIDDEFKLFKEKIDSDSFAEALEVITPIYIKMLRDAGKHLNDFKNSEKQKAWVDAILTLTMRDDELKERIDAEGEEYVEVTDKAEALLEILKTNPGIASFGVQAFTDFGKQLIDSGLISISDFKGFVPDGVSNSKLQELVVKLISQQAYNANITVWTPTAIKSLIGKVQQLLLSKNQSNIIVKAFYEEAEALQKSQADFKPTALTEVLSENVDANWDENKLKFSKGDALLNALSDLKYINPEILSELDKIYGFDEIAKSLLNNLSDISGQTMSLKDLSKSKELLNALLNGDIQAAKDLLDVQEGFEDFVDKFLEQSLKQVQKKNPYLEVRSDLMIRNLLDTNPLMRIIDDVAKKISNNPTFPTLQEILDNAERRLNSSTDPSSFVLTYEELVEQFGVLQKAIDLTFALVHGSISKRNGGIGSTESLYDYLDVYHPERSDERDDFAQLDNLSSEKAFQVLNSYSERLQRIMQLSRINSVDQDEIFRALIQSSVISYYQSKGPKWKIGKFELTLPDRSELKHITDSSELLFVYQKSISDQLQELSADQKIEFLEEYIKEFGDVELIPSYRYDEIGMELNSDGFITRILPMYLIDTMKFLSVVDPEQFYEDLISAIQDEPLKPFWTQVESLKFTYAFANADTDATKVLESIHNTLFEKFSKDGDAKGHAYLMNGNKVMLADGGAGAGKTSFLGRLIYKMCVAGKKQIEVSAMVDQKAKDLKNSVVGTDSELEPTILTGGNKQIPNLWAKLGLDSTVIDDIREQVNKWLQSQGDDGFSKEVQNAPIDEETQEGVISKTFESKKSQITLSIKYKKTSSQFSIITFDVSGLENLCSKEATAKIKEDPLLLMLTIDEASQLDPFLVTLLFHYTTSINPNSKVLLLGDLTQIGYELKNVTAAEGMLPITLPLNISSYFTQQAPTLVGTVRAYNSAARENNLNVKAVLNSYFSTLRYYETELSPEFLLQAVEAFKRIPFVYNVRELNHIDGSITHEFAGDEITNQQEIFNERVEQLSEKISQEIQEDPTSTQPILAVLVESEEDINRLKNPKAGDPTWYVSLSDEVKKRIQFHAVSQNTISGAEFDYVIIYNLKANSLHNFDSDAQKIYTYLSRRKKYSLIFEEGKDGLFTASRVSGDITPLCKSQKSNTITSISLNQSDIESSKQRLIAEAGRQAEAYEAIKPPKKAVKVTKQPSSQDTTSQENPDEGQDTFTPGTENDEQEEQTSNVTEGFIENNPTCSIVDFYYFPRNGQGTNESPVDYMKRVRKLRLEAFSGQDNVSLRVAKRQHDVGYETVYKPNNDPTLEPQSGSTIYTLEAKDSNDDWVVIGKLRNLGKDVQEAFKNTSPNSISFIEFNSILNEDESSSLYHLQKQIKDSFGKNYPNFPQVFQQLNEGSNNRFLLFTGLRNYYFDGSMKSNEWLEREHSESIHKSDSSIKVNAVLDNMGMKLCDANGNTDDVQYHIFQQSDDGWAAFKDFYSMGREGAVTEKGWEKLKKIYYNRLWSYITFENTPFIQPIQLIKYRNGSWKVDEEYPNYKDILNVIDYILTKGEEIDGIPRLSAIKLTVDGIEKGAETGTVKKTLTEEQADEYLKRVELFAKRSDIIVSKLNEKGFDKEQIEAFEQYSAAYVRNSNKNVNSYHASSKLMVDLKKVQDVWENNISNFTTNKELPIQRTKKDLMVASQEKLAKQFDTQLEGYQMISEFPSSKEEIRYQSSVNLNDYYVQIVFEEPRAVLDFATLLPKKSSKPTTKKKSILVTKTPPKTQTKIKTNSGEEVDINAQQGQQTNQDDFDITELMEENRDLKQLMDYLIEEMIQADPNFLESQEWVDMKSSMDKILEFVGKKLSTEHEIYQALKAEFDNYICSI